MWIRGSDIEVRVVEFVDLAMDAYVQGGVDSQLFVRFDYPDRPSSSELLGTNKTLDPYDFLSIWGLFGLFGLVVRSHFEKTNAGLDWTRSLVLPNLA